MRHKWAALCLAVGLAGMAHGRAPLVSLTVSILSNATGDGVAHQATFDRSDYAYPLPQTGLSTFGFAGELYVPMAAECADEVVGREVRESSKPVHPNGIVFLPYRSCRTEWEKVLRQEAADGRAVGALLYSLKDDAAQAAELVVADLAALHAPVWMVNAVAGDYLTMVLRRVYQEHPVSELPLPPNSAEYQELQDDTRLAVRVAAASTAGSPRVFVSITRSAADVATQDRNFFLKAMVGVGITGIVCFFIAILVRYFDCISSRQRHPRRLRRDGSEEAEIQAVQAPRRPPRTPEKRVLQRHELDRLPCTVVRDRRPPAAHIPWRAVSCPDLPLPHSEGPAMQRIYSTQDTTRLAEGPNGWSSDSHECAICLDVIGVGDVIRCLPCPHVFHAECIDRWLLFQSSVCPLCKRDTIYDGARVPAG